MEPLSKKDGWSATLRLYRKYFTRSTCQTNRLAVSWMDTRYRHHKNGRVFLTTFSNLLMAVPATLQAIFFRVRIYNAHRDNFGQKRASIGTTVWSWKVEKVYFRLRTIHYWSTRATVCLCKPDRTSVITAQLVTLQRMIFASVCFLLLHPSTEQLFKNKY